MYRLSLVILAASTASMFALAITFHPGDAIATFVRSRGTGKIDCMPTEKITFVNTVPTNPIANSEIHMMNPDGSERVALTSNAFADANGAFSGDGKGKMVITSNRLHADPNSLEFDSFLMNHDGTSDNNFEPLFRGGFGDWTPDSKGVAFARSSSGVGTTLPGFQGPGAVTTDHDIYLVTDLDDLIAIGDEPFNLTATFTGTSATGTLSSDDDPEVHPDGKIWFTSRDSACATINQCRTGTEIWTIDHDGGNPVRITNNAEEERAINISPSGNKLAYLCRLGALGADFEICVMHLDGVCESNGTCTREVITANILNELHVTWSPDETQLVIQRNLPLIGNELFKLNYLPDENGVRQETQLTFPPTISFFPEWGTIQVGCGNSLQP